jgi:transcriptional regulator with XRE-family HTH domain
MDKTYPPEAWLLLGKTLEQRRAQLGYGFRQRRKFLADRGGVNPPSTKMLDRLERGERTTYPDTTVTYLEALYGYEAGSFEAILNGDEPQVFQAAQRPAAVPAPVLSVSDADLDDGEGPIPAEMLYVLRTDADARLFWRLEKDGRRRPRAERIELIRFLLKLDAGENGTGNGHGGRESA